MGDQDDGLARSHQGAEDFEQGLNLGGREHRSRLVQNQNVRPAVEDLENLHPLLLAGGQLPDVAVRLKVQAEVPGQLADLLGHLVQRQQGAPAGFPSDDHVFGHRHIGHQHKVLVYHTHTVREGVHRRVDLHRLTIDGDRALIGLEQAVENIHQSGLSGAVLPQQDVNLPLSQRKVRVIVGQYARKALGDTAHFKNIAHYQSPPVRMERKPPAAGPAAGRGMDAPPG